MRRDGVSVKYIVRSSGLQPMPFAIVTKALSIARTRKPGSMQYSPPIAEPSLRSIVPAQKRPARSVLPSLKRSSPSSTPSSHFTSPPGLSSVAKPLRKAKRKPPSLRSANDPGGLGSGQCSAWRAPGCQVHSDGLEISIHQRRLSSGHQSAPSPSTFRQSTTHHASTERDSSSGVWL